jgi:hypothetical protein
VFSTWLQGSNPSLSARSFRDRRYAISGDWLVPEDVNGLGSSGNGLGGGVEGSSADTNPRAGAAAGANPRDPAGESTEANWGPAEGIRTRAEADAAGERRYDGTALVAAWQRG